MIDDPAYLLEINGLAHETTAPNEPGPTKRPWLGVHFSCCGVYSRIYRNRQGTAYEGRCPRCHAKVRAAIGPDGSTARFFKAE